MVLVDTSVWIDHLREGEDRLIEFLERDQVMGHPFVVGELACGTLKNRSGILSALQALPQATQAADEEVMAFLEARNLMGRGVGWVDVHLLAACRLSRGKLWTRDCRLRALADDIGVGM